MNGRKLVERKKRELWIKMRNNFAKKIQRVFRGARGRVYAAIAKALKQLRAKYQFASIIIQKYIRGALSRMHVGEMREKILKQKKRLLGVMLIQRIFRGHKGREALEIEREVRRMETIAK